MSDITLNENGVNAAISYNELSEKEMRALSFTDRREGWWYYSRSFEDNISFSVSFPKNGDGKKGLRIDVLDESFGQPYDYQYMLEDHPTSEFPLKVQEFVEEQMEHLQRHGVLSGHKRGEYV